MSDKKKSKTLLEESTIRRFMTLANLKPLADSFIDKSNKINLKECGCNLEEEMHEDEPPTGEPEEKEEMGEPDGEEEGSNEELVLQLVDAIANAIEGVSGVAVSVDSSESTPPEPTETPDEQPGEEREELEEEEDKTALVNTLKEADLDVVEEAKEAPKLKKKNPVQKDHALKPLKLPKNLKEHRTVLEIATRVAKRLLSESKKASKSKK